MSECKEVSYTEQVENVTGTMLVLAYSISNQMDYSATAIVHGITRAAAIAAAKVLFDNDDLSDDEVKEAMQSISNSFVTTMLETYGDLVIEEEEDSGEDDEDESGVCSACGCSRD